MPGVLTYKPELVWEHVKESIAVHGKEDGEVDCEAAPDEEVIDGCPIACIQANLQRVVIEGRSTPRSHPTARNKDVMLSPLSQSPRKAPSFLRDGLIPAH